jgi:hypothetical protein
MNVEKNEIVVVCAYTDGCIPTWGYANMEGTDEEIRDVWEKEGFFVLEINRCLEDEANELVFS